MRHLAAMMSLFAFTMVGVSFYFFDLFTIGIETFVAILLFFWSGVFVFTLIIRSGFNKRFEDPSLTVVQLLWGTLYLLTIIYLLNEWRGLMLMAYFGMLSFGFFKLKFREFLSVILFAVLGYFLVILYIFVYESDRIEINLELLQLLAFTCSASVMLYTGSANHRLRSRSKKQYAALQEALEQNKKLATTDELTGLYNRR